LQHRTLNLGILAHVDAGKTTLTERLLYAAGVIDELGSVDHGNTQTDTLALERQRGITIKSAVVSFAIDDVTVNLIDTPGHPDFIAEVERVLGVLDGAVLVLSAVEGVQPQTRILMRALERLRVPTLLFVNKIDRRGAQYDGVLHAVSERLTRTIVPMGLTYDLGGDNARFAPFGPDDVSRLAEAVAEHDDELLAAYVQDEATVPYARVRETLVRLTAEARVHPVFFGSAKTGAGVDALRSGIAALLPAADGDREGPVSGTVFKVERGPAGEKIGYVRMFSGTLRTRDRLGEDRKVTAIEVFDRGSSARSPEVSAGGIAKLWGLGDVRIGDPIGEASATNDHHFAPPTFETVVAPRHSADRAALHTALTQLAEQDPLIDVRRDEGHGLSVSLYGEVQKEVIEATLAGDFGLEVVFRETTTICVERPLGVGEAVEVLGRGSPFLATLGLRVEPGPIGAGISLRLDVKVESIPLYVYKDVEEFRSALEASVRDTLRQGLFGWEVNDCAVVVTRSGYASPDTTSKDFRLLTPLVLMRALREAGTAVCEPIHRFHLELPADTVGPALAELARLHGSAEPPVLHGSTCAVEGDIPAARVQELRQRLPGLTRGEGVLECSFSRHEPVAGTPPTRPRSDHNPLNREEYLLHVARRIHA
jgi:ribosomal protection tetracycline resistance protein